MVDDINYMLLSFSGIRMSHMKRINAMFDDWWLLSRYECFICKYQPPTSKRVMTPGGIWRETHLESSITNWESSIRWAAVVKLASGKVIGALWVVFLRTFVLCGVECIRVLPPVSAISFSFAIFRFGTTHSSKVNSTRITGFSGRFLRSFLFFLPPRLTGKGSICVHYPCKATDRRRCIEPRVSQSIVGRLSWEILLIANTFTCVGCSLWVTIETPPLFSKACNRVTQRNMSIGNHYGNISPQLSRRCRRPSSVEDLLCHLKPQSVSSAELCIRFTCCDRLCKGLCRAVFPPEVNIIISFIYPPQIEL